MTFDCYGNTVPANTEKIGQETQVAAGASLRGGAWSVHYPAKRALPDVLESVNSAHFSLAPLAYSKPPFFCMNDTLNF